MASKKYLSAKEKITAAPASLAEAVDILKKLPAAKFDETVELHVRLGVDAQASDQSVRGSVTLPHGSPRQKRVVVFVADDVQKKEVLEAGAAEAGGEKLIEKIAASGSLEADMTVATPDMMAKVAKVARILGPKGLMPNPKLGTVSADPARVVKELLGGKMSFKMDQLGNIHEAVGKVSWPAANITGNAEALLDAVKAAKPSGSKGRFIRKVVLKSTMSPGIPVKL